MLQLGISINLQYLVIGGLQMNCFYQLTVFSLSQFYYIFENTLINIFRIILQLLVALILIFVHVYMIKNLHNKSLQQKLQHIATDSYPHRVYHQEPTLKLNKNKKYLIQEERCTQIQRQNRFLFEKLARIKERAQQQRPPVAKRRKKSKKHKEGNQNQNVQAQILFKGNATIDEIGFKVKITLERKQGYKLIAKNEHTVLFLEISYSEYMAIHQSHLQGNPYNIFQYLQITKEGLVIRMGESRNNLKKDRNTKKQDSQKQSRKKQYYSLQKLEKQNQFKSRLKGKASPESGTRLPSINPRKRFKTAHKQDNQQSSFFF